MLNFESRQRPPEMENPGRSGVQIKESSLGRVWIYSGTTQNGVLESVFRLTVWLQKTLEIIVL